MEQDVGAKVSQPGKDVEGGNDQDLLFSSSWPNLKIVFNGRVRTKTTELVEPGVTPGVVLRHNLGYVPFFIPYIPPVSSDEEGGIFIFRNPFTADEKNIYINRLTGGAQQVNVDVYLMVFALDITKNYKASNIAVGESSSARGDRDTGIKLTKENKDTTSDDLRDYIVHSRTRSPLVHEVVTGYPTKTGATASLKSFVYEHDLPYNPMFFVYQQGYGTVLMPSDSYLIVNGFAGIQTEGNKITVGELNKDNKVSIVILKDPFIINDSTYKV